MRCFWGHLEHIQLWMRIPHQVQRVRITVPCFRRPFSADDALFVLRPRPPGARLGITVYIVYWHPQVLSRLAVSECVGNGSPASSRMPVFFRLLDGPYVLPGWHEVCKKVCRDTSRRRAVYLA